MKKYAAIILALIMVLVSVPALAEKADRQVEGNIVVLTTAEDFAAGELDNVVVDAEYGNDGAIRLAEGATEGEYISDVIGVPAFEYMVASWAADTPNGTLIEVFGRAYVDMHKGWTDWLSWGTWGQTIKRGSVSGSCDLAYMDTDTFVISGSDGETASLIQLKVTFKANEDGESPVVRQLAATYKNTLDGQKIVPTYYGEEIELPEKVILDTPAYSQMVREGGIASIMCSATTICTLLNDRGEDALPDEIALIDYDSDYDGFGNWSYSVAAAGSYGYDCFCQYGNLDIVKQELAHGYSVGINVSYSSSTNGSYTYLENGAANNTAGHLITITGYETIDGVDYFYSSDSAAGSDASCARRRYRADQLEQANKGMLYIIHDKEANCTPCNPDRVEAELQFVEGSENEYALMVNGEKISMSKGFTNNKWGKDGCGIIGYYLEGEEATKVEMPEGLKTTSANNVFRYGMNISSDGNFVIKDANILGRITTPTTMHIFVMFNNGTTYTATKELVPAVTEETPAPVESTEPVATEEPAVSEDPVETPEPVDANAKGGMSAGAIVAIVVIVVAIAVVAVVLGKKKKEEK